MKLHSKRFLTSTTVRLASWESDRSITIRCEVSIFGLRSPISSFCSICQHLRTSSFHISSLKYDIRLSVFHSIKKILKCDIHGIKLTFRLNNKHTSLQINGNFLRFQIRATLKYIQDNQFPAVTVFRDNRPHYYRRDETSGVWQPIRY